METKNWTQVHICSKQNHLLYSFILRTQDLLEVDAVMREELSNQEDGSYAVSYKWEDIKENGEVLFFPCYGISKDMLFNNGIPNAVLETFRAIFRD